MTDVCSAQPRARISAWYVWDDAGNLLDYLKNDQCVHAQPGYLDQNIGALYYHVYWTALDDWNNPSAMRLVKFRVLPEPATSSCGAPRSVLELFDGSL